MFVIHGLALNVVVAAFFMASGAAVQGRWPFALAGCVAVVLAAAGIRWWIRTWRWDRRDARNVYVLVAVLGGVGLVGGMRDEDYALSAAFLTSCVAAVVLAEYIRRQVDSGAARLR